MAIRQANEAKGLVASAATMTGNDEVPHLSVEDQSANGATEPDARKPPVSFEPVEFTKGGSPGGRNGCGYSL